MVRIMIREGQNINQQTQNKGNTPIHIAAKNGHYLIVKLLLELNADSTIVNLDGLTALQLNQETLQYQPAKIETLSKKQKVDLVALNQA